METGRRRVSVSELRALSELYGVDIAWLSGTDSADPSTPDERVQLAARELAKLRSEDLQSVLNLLSTLKKSAS